MTVFFQFEHADRFTAGAVGRPGQRTFFIQMQSDDETVTIKCEKQQVAAMADYLRGLLADVPTPDQVPSASLMELTAPVEPSFVLGPIGLAYDRETGRFVVQLEELVPDFDPDDVDEDEVVEEPERSTVRTLLSPGQVLSFCDHVDELVAAGRPPCVYCGGPIDPQGHACPRMN